jgi:hypothetical protein
MSRDVIRDAAVMERMRLTFDLFEAAEQMMRLNLRRRHPEADEQEIERLLTAWLHTRPGAEHGDASGPHFRVRERK